MELKPDIWQQLLAGQGGLNRTFMELKHYYDAEIGKQKTS